MVHTMSATPLDAVLVERQGDHVEVWLRKNIETDWHDNEDGGSQQFWEADEVHGTMPLGTTAADALADFDRIWERFEYSDREYAELIADGISSILGGSAGAVTDRNVTKGELVLAGEAAYVAIRNIPRGATLVEGMNVVRTDIAELLNQLQSKED